MAAKLGWVRIPRRKAQDELDAYHIAAEFFGCVVPLTFTQYQDGRRRVLQQHAGRTAHAAGVDLLQHAHTACGVVEIAAIVALDLARGNLDRHGDNWCLDDDGHFWAIDNEPGDNRRISLSQALRPAYRACLVDDLDWTPLLIEQLSLYLRTIQQAHLAPAAVHECWEQDLARWLDTFSSSRAVQTQLAIRVLRAAS